MIIYNTTFHIEPSVLQEGVEFLRKEYIPAVVAGGFLHTPSMSRIVPHQETNEPGENYSIQFRVKNIDSLVFWMEKEGSALHKRLTARFGQKIVGFSTLLEEIDLD